MPMDKNKHLIDKLAVFRMLKDRGAAARRKGVELDARGLHRLAMLCHRDAELCRSINNEIMRMPEVPATVIEEEHHNAR